jgi:chloride channel 3/4/5
MADSAQSIDASPSGPLSGPSDTTWRRQRLLRIGSSESTFLRSSTTRTASYGTIPNKRRSSNPATPLSPHSSSFRNSYFRINSQRPISAYDAALVDHSEDDDLHARTNGIRVWYSSFASIDWLHDAIKDSIRFSRLRRGKSLHSKIKLLVDKSIGWIVVTLIGFFTAIVAFLVVRGEQWLFDLKEGRCNTGWTKPKRFCCPVQGGRVPPTFYMGAVQADCPAWMTWAEVLGASERGKRMVGYRAELVQYVAYAFFAVCLHHPPCSPSILTTIQLLLASLSCLLTIYLTASTSFVTRKESGVLSPNFPANDTKTSPNDSEPKRKVLYYVSPLPLPL